MSRPPRSGTLIAFMEPVIPPAAEVRPAPVPRFLSYLYSVFFSAFNDNVHCFAIGLYLAKEASANQSEAATWQSLAGAAFGLPFILFSPLAGSLAS